MRHHPHEFVANIPGKERRRGILARLQKVGVTCLVEWRFPVGRVDQDVRIEYQHLFFVQYPIEFVTIGDINPESSTVPSRELPRGIRLAFEERGRGKDTSEPRLYKSRHCCATPRSFFLQLPHDSLINIERRLHMDNHTINISIFLVG